VASLTTAQIGALTTSQVSAGLTTNQIVALSTSQVQALTTGHVSTLTTNQIAAIETRDIAVLKTAQLQALTTSQIQTGLTTAQVAAFTTAQVEALTSAQVGAMTTAQVQQLKVGSPIVLDLNGDGVHTTSIAQGVQFDLFATGSKVTTGWVDATDGLLALDRNSNGSIDDGSELFGTSTTLANGQNASNGYEALAQLDANADGVIDAKDAAYSNLKVWVDANGDGVSESGELKSLASLNVASINVNGDKTAAKDNGNWIGMQSTFTKTDGSTAATGDVWFTTDKSAAEAAATATSLSSKVGSMVQAMTAFNAGDASVAAGGLTLPNLAGAQTGLLASVGTMVDVMKQFDANGNKVSGANAAMTSTAESLAKSVTTPQDSGFLTTGGRK
jgi:hypothetical protein